MRRETMAQQLGDYQHMMLRLAQAELADARFDKKHFYYNNNCYELTWPQAEAKDAAFFRPHEGLGKQLIAQAKAHNTSSLVQLELNYAMLETQLVDVRNYIGQSGELSVEKYSIETSKQRQEYLLVAACTDTGTQLGTTTAQRLLLVPGVEQINTNALHHHRVLQDSLQALRLDYYAKAEDENEQYYLEETEKLEQWSEDRRVALDIRIKQLDKEISIARRTARQLPTLQEKMDAKRALKKLERERDKTMLNYHEEKKKIEAKEDELLEEVAAALQMTTHTELLFSVNWILKDEQ
jgi:hypothetical protein